MDPVTAGFLIAAVAGGGLAARQASNAGKAQEIQFKEQAKQEEVGAKDREIERRRSLIEAISTQNAEAGAVGDSINVGSRRAIALEDIRRSRLDNLTDRAVTGRNTLNLRSQGRFAKRQGNLEAAGTLLSTGGKYGGDLKTAVFGAKKK